MLSSYDLHLSTQLLAENRKILTHHARSNKLNKIDIYATS